MIRRNKKSLLSILGLQLCCAAVNVQATVDPSPSLGTVAQNFATTVFCDSLSVAKNAAIVALGVPYLGLKAFVYQVPPRAQLGIIIAGIAAAKAWRNRAQLKSMNTKFDRDKLMIGDKPGSVTQFAKWKINPWNTARSINQQWKDVLRALATDQKIDLKIMDKTGKQCLSKPTWLEIIDAIKEEKKALWKDMDRLEKEHLVYLDFFPQVIGSFGIVRDYKNACKNVKADPNAPASWTEQQEKDINAYMENPWDAQSALLNLTYRPIFFLIKPNYNYAAQTYWKIKTVWQRLEALESLIREIPAELAEIEVHGQRVEKIIQKIEISKKKRPRDAGHDNGN